MGPIRQVARLSALASVAMVFSLLLGPTMSFAHERRTIATGKYDVVVGWDLEPAFVNQKNGASIRISKAGTNPAEPVVGAEKTLKIDIRQGATTRTFALRSVFGQPGYYIADILPTRDGDYQWTFTGTIGSDSVNEKFDTADGKFDKVGPTTELQFPIVTPDPAQVAADLQTARAAAASAQTMATIGVALGALGLLVAVVVWLTRPKRTDLPLGGATRRAAGERLS